MKHRFTDIIDAAAELSLIPAAILLGKSRVRRVAEVRAAVVVVAREVGHSYPFLAKKLSKDHSSLIHYVQNFDVYAKRSPWLAPFIIELRDRIVERGAFGCNVRPIKVLPVEIEAALAFHAKPKPMALRPIIDIETDDREADNKFHRRVAKASTKFAAALNAARAA